MLRLIESPDQKAEAQGTLEKNLKKSLKHRGVMNIGFPGGNKDANIYSNGPGQLWTTFGRESEKFWNAFGVLEPDRRGQIISVEINIPLSDNSAKTGGYFSEEVETARVVLMHSGKVGGGTVGVGLHSFLAWSKLGRVDVFQDDQKSRLGVPIGYLDDPYLSNRIWSYVQKTKQFKEAVRSGQTQSPEFKAQVQEFENFSGEFSGRRQGARSQTIDYLTYHGDVVNALYRKRMHQKNDSEQVFNNILIDLYVKRNDQITEIYEVKTSGDRQSLYTAIGQLETHATHGQRHLKKFLVVPHAWSIPDDVNGAIQRLNITILEYQLVGKPGAKEVQWVERGEKPN